MDNSFFIYMERLEFLLFFSGYPLLYFLVLSIAESKPITKYFSGDLSAILPVAYAVVGILYLGLQLKNLYPDYSIDHIRSSSTIPFLRIWGLLSIGFLLPMMQKKTYLSLLHSFVFVFFIIRDLYLIIFSVSENGVLKNDMHMYSYSLLINIVAFVFTGFLFLLFKRIKFNKK